MYFMAIPESIILNPFKNSTFGKVYFLDLLPAAKKIVYGKQLQGGELARILGGRLRIAWTIKIHAYDILRLGSVKIIDISGRRFAGAVPVSHGVDHADCGLGHYRHGWRDNFKIIRSSCARLSDQQMSLIFPHYCFGPVKY